MNWSVWQGHTKELPPIDQTESHRQSVRSVREVMRSNCNQMWQGLKLLLFWRPIHSEQLHLHLRFFPLMFGIAWCVQCHRNQWYPFASDIIIANANAPLWTGANTIVTKFFTVGWCNEVTIARKSNVIFDRVWLPLSTVKIWWIWWMCSACGRHV